MSRCNTPFCSVMMAYAIDWLTSDAYQSILITNEFNHFCFVESQEQCQCKLGGTSTPPLRHRISRLLSQRGEPGSQGEGIGGWGMPRGRARSNAALLLAACTLEHYLEGKALLWPAQEWIATQYLRIWKKVTLKEIDFGFVVDLKEACYCILWYC